MKSPRFDIRAAPLRSIFSASNIERIWTEKVRVAMRDQFVNDGVEHFDFHVARTVECAKLSRLIMDGDYVPAKAQRILVEKSKGLCRQLVIPSISDAIVLQCLSDALYSQVRGKAPTKKAFFEPKDHQFKTTRHEYGTFAAWLNFQRELFQFSRNRDFIVITDIANYYDSISYTHLRNVIASIAGVEEPILDMLIYVLSDLLWQPDYTPRIEIGLPQINMDAPRLLAHCFLYELDAYLASDPSRDFVRYMDDIDVGVDSVVEAKTILRSIDLVLQTKQVRLNSGKTLILSQQDALRHFRVRENALLDFIDQRIARRRKAGLPLFRDRRFIEVSVRRGLKRGDFDSGNGDKILKRYMTLATATLARIDPKALLRIITHRPSVREKAFAYIRRLPLSPARAHALADAAASGLLVDDAGMVEMANYLVETRVRSKHKIGAEIDAVIATCNDTTYFGLYAKLWLQSKFASCATLLGTMDKSKSLWVPHETLGRLIGAMAPLFVGSTEQPAYLELLGASHNKGARDTYRFQKRLASDPAAFGTMFNALKALNPSRGTRMTHAKFLCLLSALMNPTAPAGNAGILRATSVAVFEDVYYRGIARRLGVL